MFAYFMLAGNYFPIDSGLQGHTPLPWQFHYIFRSASKGTHRSSISCYHGNCFTINSGLQIMTYSLCPFHVTMVTIYFHFLSAGTYSVCPFRVIMVTISPLLLDSQGHASLARLPFSPLIPVCEGIHCVQCYHG